LLYANGSTRPDISFQSGWQKIQQNQRRNT
jgi:hypothetical protein